MRSVPRILRIACAAAALPVAVNGCSGGGTEPSRVATTVVITPRTASFTAIGQTQQFAAVVKDQFGDTLVTAGVTWSSSNTAAVSVNSSSGLATAVANGTAQVTATSGTATQDVNVTVTQVAAQITKVSGDEQTGTVAQALAQQLVVVVRDANSNAIANLRVNFTVTQGAGTLNAAADTTDASGQAQVTWTLGQTAGTAHQVTAALAQAGAAAVTFSATALAGPPAFVTVVSGNNQSGVPSAALASPIVVSVTDQFSNVGSGLTVNFTVTAGGGSVNPTSAVTGANGQAQTTWTLGPSAGSQTLQASVAGAPLVQANANATATNLTITSVTPDTLVEGQSATITGTDFSLTPANNTVMIGGVAASVTAASATSLTVTVPTSNCQPARDAAITVAVGAATSNSVTKRLHPASFVNLAVGQQLIVTDPAQFCLQFRPSVTGNDSYVIGLGASAETPTGVLPHVLTGVAGVAAAAPALVSARVRTTLGAAEQGAFPAALDAEALALRRSHARAELALREWERRNLLDRPNARLQIAARRAGDIPAAPPSVGDTIRFRITSFSNPCNSFTEALTRVKVVGQRGIWVTDINNPATDSLTTAEMQGYSDTLDTHVYARDTTYFGAPSDLDNNQRIIIVLSIEVNKIPLGVAGFVFAGDLFSRSSCASSNLGEVFYSHVPDPGNVAGTGARSKSSILFQMPSLIAHEFTHVIQESRRLVLANGQDMTSWEAEGQASLAEEVVGHSVLGNSIGQNYGADVAFAPGLGQRWYQGLFVQLALYYGWIPPGTSTKAADAPEMCSLFATTGITTSCDPFAFYGASWSFQRYVSDRFGPSYPGGEAGLHRDWISKNVGLRGVPNVAALLGVNVDSLLAQWAATLYVDGRVASPPSPVAMSGWDLLNVFAAFVNDNFRLVPPSRSFANFSDSRSVRGGSTAYTLLGSSGARPAMAVRARDSSGNPLATTLRPQLWIARLQ
jgi:hypothetical protein